MITDGQKQLVQGKMNCTWFRRSPVSINKYKQTKSIFAVGSIFACKRASVLSGTPSCGFRRKSAITTLRESWKSCRFDSFASVPAWNNTEPAFCSLTSLGSHVLRCCSVIFELLSQILASEFRMAFMLLEVQNGGVLR